jgi:hypothetical protein
MEFEIMRTDSPPNEDKFVVQFATALPKENDPTNAFKSTSSLGKTNLPVSAVAAIVEHPFAA